MQNPPKISDAEWQIMKVLWGRSPLTAAEIIEVLRPSTTWSSKTIHTLISRLVSKGAIKIQKDVPFYQYSPVASEKECRMEETESFLHKVYDGSLNLLISSFIKKDKLTHEEIEELQRILNKSKE